MGSGDQGKRENTLLEAGCLDIVEETEDFPVVNDSGGSGIPFPQGRRENTAFHG
jgi:hypothetical protein